MEELLYSFRSRMLSLDLHRLQLFQEGGWRGGTSAVASHQARSWEVLDLTTGDRLWLVLDLGVGLHLK